MGQDGENTIDAITLTFTPTTPFSRDIETLEINGVYLSGDINIDGKVSLKGLETLPTLPALSQLNAKQISLKNINLSFLSAHFGGLRGVVNINGNHEDDAIIWNGTIDSRQDQLELVAKLNAQTNDSGRWIADFEIENAKLERSFGKFTRVSGGATYAGSGHKWKSLKGELSAGGFSAYDTMWQNAAITIDATPKLTKTYISAKSSGIEGLELNIDTTLSLKKIDWSARIFAETGQQMIRYFQSHNMLPINEKDLKKMQSLQNVTLHLKPTSKSLIFKVSNDDQEIDIKGKIDNINGNNFTALFTTSEQLSNTISGAKCTINKAKKRQLCRMNIIRKNHKYIQKD